MNINLMSFWYEVSKINSFYDKTKENINLYIKGNAMVGHWYYDINKTIRQTISRLSLTNKRFYTYVQNNTR